MMNRRNKKKQAVRPLKTGRPQTPFIPTDVGACDKEVPLKTGKLPQIFRRLEALGFARSSDSRYVNSNAEANIQAIALGRDKIEGNCVWLIVTARKPFAHSTAASERFAQRRQEELTQRLELAKKYWLRTIQPHINDRALRGVELYVATDAHLRLRTAQQHAEVWNQTVEGQRAPVPAEAFADWNRDEFREPQELCRDEKLIPELLAGIAAPMMGQRTADLTRVAVVGVAHDLLRAAQQYVNALPEEKRGEARIMEDFQTAFSMVTFAEIEASNKRNSGQLPLLPPVAQKRKDITDDDLREKPLSRAGIKNAVKRFPTPIGLVLPGIKPARKSNGLLVNKWHDGHG